MRKTDIKLDHIAVQVKDIDIAFEWLNKAFGFNQILPPGKVEMKASGKNGQRCCITNQSGIVLELEQISNKPFEMPENTKAAISHISFKTTNLKGLHKHLLKLGYIDPAIEIRDMKVVHILYFTGIDGVEIEIIEYQNK